MYKVDKRLIDSARRIKRKYEQLKKGNMDFQQEQSERYQPIIEAIQQIPQPEQMPVIKEEKEPIATQLMADKYLKYHINKPNLVDKTHGVYMQDNNLMIGDSELKLVANSDNILIKGKLYNGTEGLWQLLVLKAPFAYTMDDLEEYTDIVKRTNAHRQNYLPTGNPLSSRSKKYLTFIKPIVDEETVPLPRTRARTISTPSRIPIRSPTTTTPTTTPTATGKGLGKVVSNNKLEYVYWNDINELVDRLKLLVMAKEAGNTSVHNEIINILEELREEGVIA